jgi:hypothetical protein
VAARAGPTASGPHAAVARWQVSSPPEADLPPKQSAPSKEAHTAPTHLELVEGAERLVDCLGQLARGRAARVGRHRLPEEGVVPHLRGGVCVWGGGVGGGGVQGDFERRPRQAAAAAAIEGWPQWGAAAGQPHAPRADASPPPSPPPKTSTCAALLNTGVGLPLFQDASTISSRDLPSRSVPAICLFMLSGGRRGGGGGAGVGLARGTLLPPHARALVEDPPAPRVGAPARLQMRSGIGRLTDVGAVVLAPVELQGLLGHVGLQRVERVGRRLELDRGAHHDGAAGARLGEGGGGRGGGVGRRRERRRGGGLGDRRARPRPRRWNAGRGAAGRRGGRGAARSAAPASPGGAGGRGAAPTRGAGRVGSWLRCARWRCTATAARRAAAPPRRPRPGPRRGPPHAASGPRWRSGHRAGGAGLHAARHWCRRGQNRTPGAPALTRLLRPPPARGAHLGAGHAALHGQAVGEGHCAVGIGGPRGEGGWGGGRWCVGPRRVV